MEAHTGVCVCVGGWGGVCVCVWVKGDQVGSPLDPATALGLHILLSHAEGRAEGQCSSVSLRHQASESEDVAATCQYQAVPELLQQQGQEARLSTKAQPHACLRRFWACPERAWPWVWRFFAWSVCAHAADHDS